MHQLDFIQLVEQRLTALEARLTRLRPFWSAQFNWIILSTGIAHERALHS
jgi:hypothetical protein